MTNTTCDKCGIALTDPLHQPQRAEVVALMPGGPDGFRVVLPNGNDDKHISFGLMDLCYTCIKSLAPLPVGSQDLKAIKPPVTTDDYVDIWNTAIEAAAIEAEELGASHVRMNHGERFISIGKDFANQIRGLKKK